jgi:hypothetical protein
MPNRHFVDDHHDRGCHVSDVHVSVLVKELLDLMLQIGIGGESAGVFSNPDSLKIFIRPHRKNFDPQMAYLSICDRAELWE